MFLDAASAAWLCRVRGYLFQYTPRTRPHAHLCGRDRWQQTRPTGSLHSGHDGWPRSCSRNRVRGGRRAAASGPTTSNGVEATVMEMLRPGRSVTGLGPSGVMCSDADLVGPSPFPAAVTSTGPPAPRTPHDRPRTAARSTGTPVPERCRFRAGYRAGRAPTRSA